MTLPLSKYEMQLLQNFEKLFDVDTERNSVVIKYETFLKYQEWIDLMQERGFLMVGPYDDGKICNKMADFTVFNKWIYEENGKAKRLKLRDWAIAIAGALAGVLGTVIAQKLM